jgi:gliding motility-associated-like protein
MKKQLKKLLLIAVLLVFSHYANAQICNTDTNYLALVYRNNIPFNFTTALTTPDDNILCFQNNNYYPSALTKMTPQGSVIWSNTYDAPFKDNGNHSWTDLLFNTISLSPDNSYFLAGSVTKHGQFFDNTEVPPARTVAVLVKTDKYGTVSWSRYISNQTTDPLTFSDIAVTKSNNAICYLSTTNIFYQYGKILSINSDGNINWITGLNTGIFYSGRPDMNIKRKIKELNNDNIIVADIVFDSSQTTPAVYTGEFHFFSLDGLTGKLLWETSYEYPIPNGFYFPSINNISELSNGTISIQTSLNISTLNYANSTPKAINIILDNKGTLTDILGYYPSGGYCSTIDAATENQDKQVLLLEDENRKAILLSLKQDENINWSKRYGKTSENQPPTCLNVGFQGYNIFMSDFSKSAELLETDQVGNIDCDTTYVKMNAEHISLPETANRNNIQTITDVDFQSFFTGFFVTKNHSQATLTREVYCQKKLPCCEDFVDTTHKHEIQICAGSQYILPDNTVIKDSGIYDVSYKTQIGCDSVILYHAIIIKNPSDLSLGKDTCFTGESSIKLQATEGYDSYNWMHNEIIDSQSTYTATTAGIYYVTVSNYCGTKTDSIQVFEKCDFPVYMPSAFTPNNDGLNDVFRVPPTNNNQLIRLTIYNRWGQLVFSTTDITKGWDGNVNNVLQPPGAYIYYLQMAGLTGNKISQKGAFVLIR